MPGQTLESEHELLERLVDSIPVMLVIWDPGLRRFKLNRNTEEVLGWTDADANEGDFMAKVYPNPEYRAMVVAFMKSLNPSWRTLLAMTKQGELIPIEWTNLRLSDDRMVGIGMDLRERKRAEKEASEAEKRMQLAADAAGICAWDVDLESGEATYSDSASKVFGVEKLGEEFYTMHAFQNRIHEDDRLRVKRHIEEAIRDTGTYVDQFRFQTNELMWIEARGRVIYDAEGTPLRMLGIAQNITRRKRMEKELRDHREKLELLVRARTEDLEASRARAQSEADKRRYLAKRLIDLLEEDRRNLSMMLHDDIGQRLIGARMKVESIQRKMSDEGSAESGELACVVEDLQDVIASLRDKGRQLLPPSLLLLGLIPSLRSLGDGLTDAACRMHSFFGEVPEDLDPDMQLAMYRIAQEAVINAVRHSGCSEIHLSLTFQDHTLRLIVEDDGCGFEWKESVFEISGRGPLGLVIMRERANFIGGDLVVESSPGRGTVVIAEIPVDTTPAA